MISPEALVSDLYHDEGSMNAKQNGNPHENGMKNPGEKNKTGINEVFIKTKVTIGELFDPNGYLNQTIKKRRRQDDRMDCSADAPVVCANVKNHDGESILEQHQYKKKQCEHCICVPQLHTAGSFTTVCYIEYMYITAIVNTNVSHHTGICVRENVSRDWRDRIV